MTTQAQTASYAADGIAVGLSTCPHPKPVMTTAALVEACRVQARTWVTRTVGVRTPDELSGQEAGAYQTRPIPRCGRDVRRVRRS
ncbi:hypothetical protein ACIO6T_31075 [Streptomyces sp. NPDC087532]|uniref:hypothetical protein n=1 Tax=Streptomyces sp. NPDC087532 TaxID=3365795 RepID=UPI0037F7D1FC